MRYYVIDAMGNCIMTETDEVIARAIAEEIGGDYIADEE